MSRHIKVQLTLSGSGTKKMDAFHQPGNLSAGLFLMDHPFASRLLDKRNRYFQRFFSLFKVSTLKGGSNRFHYILYPSLPACVSRAFSFILSRPFQGGRVISHYFLRI
jgi:hypothetical protein